MYIPYDEKLGVHPQADGFTDHQQWDFEGTPAENYPLLLHYPYFDLYRKQVVKQADLVLAMQVRGDAFTDEQKARNFAYYERLTVRDSSLSACTQAVMAAEVGQLDLAYDYTAEAALMDLHDLGGNTRDGLHMASLAGACIALVAGFGGLRDHGEVLGFRPRLPAGLARLAFSMRVRQHLLRVRITHETTTYTLDEGSRLRLSHDGKELTVAVGAPVERPTFTPAPGSGPPSRPAGSRPGASRRPGPPPARASAPRSTFRRNSTRGRQQSWRRTAWRTRSSRSCGRPGSSGSTGWSATASTRWSMRSGVPRASPGCMCATRRPAPSRRPPRPS